MTYDLSRVSQEIPSGRVEATGKMDGVTLRNGNGHNGEMNGTRRRSTISRSSSIDSVAGDRDSFFARDYISSEELDKLSNALSEVSSDSSGEATTSLAYDIIQAQLALWTTAGSLLYSYAWMQHRKKFVMSIFVVVPITFTLTCMISSLLTTIVIIGRIFSTPVNYRHYLDMNRNERGFRQRSYSGTSTVSEDILPKPLCRRHSGSHSSLNNSRPPSVNRKLSYCYSHYNHIEDKD